VVHKRESIQRALTQLDTLVFTSSRTTETFVQEIGLDPLGQMLSARELLRRPSVTYHQVTQLAHNVFHTKLTATEYSEDNDGGRAENVGGHSHDSEYRLPVLSASVAEEVELQVKYESYVRKQEQIVHRTRRMEEHHIPETIDYNAVQHLRTQARQKLTRTRPRTVGQASRVEGVTPADIAMLMIYLEKQHLTKAKMPT
jgi:tRNA uridine 5-carboxymethylaminomethyl modification enzyme